MTPRYENIINLSSYHEKAIFFKKYHFFVYLIDKNYL